MDKFAKWLEGQVEKAGGLRAFCVAIDSHSDNVGRWVFGLSQPDYCWQLAIARATNTPLREIRLMIDRPYTRFAELVAESILEVGTVSEFVEATGLEKSTLNQWLSAGILPSVGGSIRIREALLIWNRSLRSGKLRNDLEEAIALDIKDRKDALAKKRSEVKESRKFLIPCNIA